MQLEAILSGACNCSFKLASAAGAGGALEEWAKPHHHTEELFTDMTLLGRQPPQASALNSRHCASPAWPVAQPGHVLCCCSCLHTPAASDNSIVYASQPGYLLRVAAGQLAVANGFAGRWFLGCARFNKSPILLDPKRIPTVHRQHQVCIFGSLTLPNMHTSSSSCLRGQSGANRCVSAASDDHTHHSTRVIYSSAKSWLICVGVLFAAAPSHSLCCLAVSLSPQQAASSAGVPGQQQ